MDGHGMERYDMAWAWRGVARQGKARQGMARKAWLGSPCLVSQSVTVRKTKQERSKNEGKKERNKATAKENKTQWVVARCSLVVRYMRGRETMFAVCPVHSVPVMS